MRPLGLVVLCSHFWSCLFRGKVARMLGVHRRYSFLVLKVYLGSVPPDLERLGIITKGFQIGTFFLNQFANAEKTSSYESLQLFCVS